MDKPISQNPMEPFPLSDECQFIRERMPMNLQRFAIDEIDWRRIYETQPPEDLDEGETFIHTPVFKTPSENSTDDPTTDDDVDDDESVIREPIFMPRLSITDKNLSYLSNGEMVIADEEGNLSTASVDEDGAMSTTPIQINGEMIQEESIPGSRLMENAITSRELDMEDLFSDSALLNQLVAANIDTDDLFLNDQFIEKLTDRIAAHPIDSLQIVDGAITRAKIGDAAIGAAQIDAANINWASIANLVADISQIAKAQITTANIREANIDWANIANLAADVAAIAKAQIDTASIREANIDWANIETLATAAASIAKTQITTANIIDANISWAQITSLTTSIASIAAAHIENLEVGNLMVRGANGKMFQIIPDGGDGASSPLEVMIHGEDMEEGTITTRELNVTSIFEDAKFLGKLSEFILPYIIENVYFKHIISKIPLLDNLTDSVHFSDLDMTIESKGKEFAARVAAKKFELLKRVGESYESFTEFSTLKAITSPFLQIGVDTAINPKMKLGKGVFEFNSSTGNFACRKA